MTLASHVQSSARKLVRLLQFLNEVIAQTTGLPAVTFVLKQ